MSLWIFALDQTNYDKCLPGHIRELISLNVRHPILAADFRAGNFIIYKTINSMSAIAKDHEHNNGPVKGSGGAVGLTENPSAFRRWMVAGPEFARMLWDFEDILHKANQNGIDLHHEQVVFIQKAFSEQVKSLVSIMNEMGNPFKEESTDLLVLDSKEIMNTEVVHLVRNIEDIGRKQYQTFRSSDLILQRSQ